MDVRLTAEDGYQAERSYSIASPPEDSRLSLTVEQLKDGEVSPYLSEELRSGDTLELRGPIGGYFVWDVSLGGPLLLVAGGSGIVPLMAMLRARDRQPFRLVYSSRTPDDVIYAGELREQVRRGVDVRLHHTRVPGGRRIGVATLNTYGWPPVLEPDCYVCGPTGFVETAADILVALGHDPRRIRTERFGGA